MPREDLSVPGFYGKMPATGDFVVRGLPANFVRRWDRWLSEHLAPLANTKFWDEAKALRFLSGAFAFGAAAGIVVASRDRAGRRFPLSIVALPRQALMAHARADSWFQSIEAVGRTAQQCDISPDALDRALSALPMPEHDGVDEIVKGMLVWTEHSDWYDMDLIAPQATLATLLGPDAGNRSMCKTAV